MKQNIKPEEDAVGRAMMAFYEGRKSYEVLEREDGYFDANTTGMYFADFEKWREHEKKAIEYVKGRVLDIGCGAGRHSLYLQKKGLDVTAVDKSPLVVEVCKLRGVKKAMVLPLRDIGFKPNTFDTILMLGGNFQLFGTPKRAQRFLKRFYRMTSKDAIILAEAVDPYATDNPAQLRYYDLNRKREKLAGQWRIRIRFQVFATKWFDLLLVSKEEMVEILKGTGWQVQAFIDTDSPAYIAIIDKDNESAQR